MLLRRRGARSSRDTMLPPLVACLQVTIDQVIGGARGIKSMVWETSNLDADEVRQGGRHQAPHPVDTEHYFSHSVLAS